MLTSARTGVRVRRGKDWKWGEQDGNGPGTTVASGDSAGWGLGLTVRGLG